FNHFNPHRLNLHARPQYSMLWPFPQDEIFPRCAELGIGQIVWSPLAQGVLTGKYRPEAPPPAGSRAGHASMGAMLPKEWLRAPVLTAVQQVKLMAERETGLSLAQFALAWVLRRQEVSSAIIGASRPEQVTENAAAADCEVAPELFARAGEILAPFQRNPSGVYARLRKHVPEPAVRAFRLLKAIFREKLKGF
ncbi:MAG: aldo/keto reductase, partial [Methylocella sp.]